MSLRLWTTLNLYLVIIDSIGFNQPSGEDKLNWLENDLGNEGIVHLFVQELFLELDKRQGHYEVSCSMSELSGHELKHIQNGQMMGVDGQVTPRQGSFSYTCNSAKSVLEVLNAVNDSGTQLITLKIFDIDHATYGIFHIILLSENEPLTQSGPSVSTLSSLERFFIQEQMHEQPGAFTDNETLTEILRRNVSSSNTCLILSVSSQERQVQQIMRILRLGSAIHDTDSVESDGTIPNSVLVKGNVDFDERSGSQLSLHASMINSSIINVHMTEEDFHQNVQSPDKWIDNQERDSPHIHSDIFVNLGKHLYEETHVASACQKGANNEGFPVKASGGFLAVCMAIVSTLLALSSAVFFVYMKMRHLPADIIPCIHPAMPTNATHNPVNFVHFETTRKIIVFVQEVDLFFTHPEYSPWKLKYFLVTTGFSLLIVASLIFTMFSIFGLIASTIVRKFKRVKNIRKKKFTGKAHGKADPFGEQKMSMKSQSPYLKHPRIMSPLDSSNIFMSRYTGTIVTNNGIIADVVRSSRIGTPSPSKYGTPSSCEKMVKLTPADPSVLAAVMEEDQ